MTTARLPLSCSTVASLLVTGLIVLATPSSAGSTQATKPTAADTPVIDAAAQEPPTGTGKKHPQQIRHHALSLIGKPKFAPDFKHFDWVNPDAPKGGNVRQWAFGSFDSLNAFTVKGDSAQGLGLIYDQLMVSSADEPSTEYGLIAEWVSYPDDFSSATFKLRPEARFHDGRPITPEDVIFTMNAVKKAHPGYAFYYKNVVKVEKTGPHEVTFRFNVKGNRELPLIVSQLSILPKHHWTGKTSDGKQRDLTKSSLDMPLGSGPYKIARLEPGRSIEYERVKNWWARDLPVTRGQYNFDRISYTYYRDRTPAFEAFKSGQIDIWYENSSQKWARAYDFPAVRKGSIKKHKITLKTPQPMQAFALNTRRVVFKDARVRQAFNLAFDFEWANQNLFYNQYRRISSYFENTELRSSGLPSPEELEFLEPLRGQIPDEVFTKPYKNPVNRTRADIRKHLAQAQKLLSAAGWSLRKENVEDPDCGFVCRIMTSLGLRSQKTETILRNREGKKFQIEFLLQSPTFEKVVLPYARKLQLLGIKATVRVVDSAQYQRRLKDFDFDIVIASFAQSHSPGNEQRDYWSSTAAKRPGSRNLIGIADPAIDKLIDHIIFAKSRKELVSATRALDRVLLWNHFVVPQWFVPYERIAMWEKFGQPEKQPSQSVAFLRAWWFDKAKAAKLKESRTK